MIIFFRISLSKISTRIQASILIQNWNFPLVESKKKITSVKAVSHIVVFSSKCFVRIDKTWFLQAQLERQANEHVNGQNKVQAEMSALKKDHDVAKDKVARYVKLTLSM